MPEQSGLVSLLTGGLVPSLVGAGAVLALFGLETVFPLRRRKRGRGGRVVVNMLMWGATFAAGAVVRMVAVPLASRVSESGFGLLGWLALPGWAQIAGGFVLMDLAFYYWHRLNHEVPLLWRFHNVHHIDPDLDVSTSFRFHFGEVLYSTGFRAVQVSVIGVMPVTYLLYELVFQLGTFFHHSNLRIPLGVERWINKVFVTPRMHGIHHSAVRNETNSNYSVVFRWWDLLHRSLRLNVHQDEIDIGVPAYQRAGDNRLWHLLAMPFGAQRLYWRRPDGSEAAGRETGEGAPPEAMVE
jgi:sterol desaturase/sphingolipid hydroxylase (fatty acid hydroxylase superfamily)